MNQFKVASSIKPVRSTHTLSITNKGSTHQSTRKGKKTHRKSGSMINLKVHKAYSTKPLLSARSRDQKARIIKPSEQVKAAKGIFITGTDDDGDSKPPTSQTERNQNNEPKNGNDGEELNTQPQPETKLEGVLAEPKPKDAQKS
jgi:hypothetical protein